MIKKHKKQDQCLKMEVCCCFVFHSPGVFCSVDLKISVLKFLEIGLYMNMNMNNDEGKV